MKCWCSLIKMFMKVSPHKHHYHHRVTTLTRHFHLTLTTLPQHIHFTITTSKHLKGQWSLSQEDQLAGPHAWQEKWSLSQEDQLHCVPRKSGIISKEIQTNNPRTNNRRSDNPRTDNKRTENPRTQDPKAHNPRIKDSVHGPLLRHLFFIISNHCIVYHDIHQNKII